MDQAPYRSIRAPDIGKEGLTVQRHKSAVGSMPVHRQADSRVERKAPSSIPRKPNVGRNYSRQLGDDHESLGHQMPYPTQAYVDHAYEKLSREGAGAIRSQRSLFQAPRSTSALKAPLPRPDGKRIERMSLVNQGPEQRSERVTLQPETNIKIIQTSKSFRTSDSLAERNSALELKKFKIRLSNPAQGGAVSAQMPTRFVSAAVASQYASGSMRTEQFRQVKSLVKPKMPIQAVQTSAGPVSEQHALPYSSSGIPRPWQGR